MLITVKLADGSEQTLDVESVRTTLDGAPIELSLNGAPALLRIFSPSDEARWQRFVVHHSAANVMDSKCGRTGRVQGLPLDNPPLHWTAAAERLPQFGWSSAPPRPLNGLTLYRWV